MLGHHGIKEVLAGLDVVDTLQQPHIGRIVINHSAIAQNDDGIARVLDQRSVLLLRVAQSQLILMQLLQPDLVIALQRDHQEHGHHDDRADEAERVQPALPDHLVDELGDVGARVDDRNRPSLPLERNGRKGNEFGQLGGAYNLCLDAKAARRAPQVAVQHSW